MTARSFVIVFAALFLLTGTFQAFAVETSESRAKAQPRPAIAVSQKVEKPAGQPVPAPAKAGPANPQETQATTAPVSPVVPEEITLTDGTKYTIEGENIYAMDETGKKTPVPAGHYTLNDGTEINVYDGKLIASELPEENMPVKESYSRISAVETDKKPTP